MSALIEDCLRQAGPGGMRQSELAQELGLPAARISQWKAATGKRSSWLRVLRDGNLCHADAASGRTKSPAEEGCGEQEPRQQAHPVQNEATAGASVEQSNAHPEHSVARSHVSIVEDLSSSEEGVEDESGLP